MALKLATKGINDTNGENGLVPSLLTFGVIPRFPILNTDLPVQRERMDALASAQREMQTIVAERRIQQALLSNVTQSADRSYEIGDEIPVYREASNRYEGPYEISNVDGKIVTIIDANSVYGKSSFNVQQAKHYHRGIPANDEAEVLYQMLRPFRSTEGMESAPSLSIHVTEVVHPGDPREKDFWTAKRKEIDDLIKRGTWKVILKDEMPKNANLMGGRFLLTIKNSGTNE
jgi:hypothetical protein